MQISINNTLVKLDRCISFAICVAFAVIIVPSQSIYTKNKSSHKKTILNTNEFQLQILYTLYSILYRYYRVKMYSLVAALIASLFEVLVTKRNFASLNIFKVMCKVSSFSCLLLNLKCCWPCELAKLLDSPVHRPVPAAEGG